MNIDYNEFLRVMSCILILLLVVQGLDYIMGVGVNNYLFILFCIAFAFTMGTIYHNILEERNRKDRKDYEDLVNKKLDDMKRDIDVDYIKYGLTPNVLEKWSNLEKLKDILEVSDELEFDNIMDSDVLNDDTDDTDVDKRE